MTYPEQTFVVLPYSIIICKLRTQNSNLYCKFEFPRKKLVTYGGSTPNLSVHDGFQIRYGRTCSGMFLRHKYVKILTSAKLRLSVQPAAAMSTRSKSVSLLIGKALPTVCPSGSCCTILLNPYATATSSAMSQAWMTSCRVGGIVTYEAKWDLCSNRCLIDS